MKTHQRRLHVFLFSFLIAMLLFSNGGFAVATAATKTPTVTTTPSATMTATPTITPTPKVDADAEPQAWLDAAINPEKFSTGGRLVVHFNTPIDTTSAVNPLLAWPDVPGSSEWNETQTTLTFTPAAALKGQSSYLFFLNPALRARSGKALKNAPEWQVLTSAGVKVSGITPSFGELDRRYDEITISFDQEMDTSQVEEIVSIEPAIPFNAAWKDGRRLHIQLQQPFDFGQRYRLTVQRGLLAKNGAPLGEDFTGAYQQLPAQARVESITNKEVTITFDYGLSRQKTGLGFSILPALEGEWRWVSDKQVVFKSKDRIPANQIYRIEYPGAVVDLNGFELAPPALQFSGLPPMRLLEQEDGMQKSTYQEGYYYAGIDLPEIQIQFDGTVARPTAEKAFSISPAVPGVFRWETNPQGRDILVYVLDALLRREQQYTVQVDASVKDAQGKPITVTPFQENFSVSEWAYMSTTFGHEGDNIQVVDAGGLRHIQVAADEKTVFSAYRFELIDFANLYAKYYSPRRSQNVRDIPIPAQDKPVAVWSGVEKKKSKDDYYAAVETTLPAKMEPGLYILNMSEDGRLLDQLFLVVSRNTLVVKQSGREMQAWVTDNRGRPVPNAEIRVYNAKSEKIREGKSDENGLYRVPLQESDQPVLVSARLRSPDDVTLAGFSGVWRTYEGYGGSSMSHLPGGEPFLIYLYTERPIYRPGQTVYFKAILRQDNDVKYELPGPGTPVTVQVKDTRENTLQTLRLATNDFGSVHGEFLIPEGAMLGDYMIEMDGDGFSGYGQFRVDDYRKPDYQVTITSLQPEKQDRFVHGEEVRVQVNTAYYFGEPVAGATLEAEIFYDYPIKTSITGNLTTDEQGNTVLSFKALYSDGYYYWWDSGKQRLRLQVSADDGSHQKVVGLFYFDVYLSTDRVRMDTGGYYAQPNAPLAVNISNVDIFGQPVAGRDLTLAVKRWDWTKFGYSDILQNIPLQTDVDGKASAEIRLEAGYHELTLSGEDSLGNPIEISRWLYVFKDKNDWGQRLKDSHLTISTEKESYKPYQKARLVIESTFSGPAWLTFERGSVINSKQIELTAPLTILDVDIIPEHAPNVFITVNAWQPASESVGRYGSWYDYETASDSYLRVARAYVEVDASAKALDIAITPEQSVYKPGETVSALIQVRDAAGQPVIAELSLAVVDEAIFALARPSERDISRPSTARAT
jgi:alpha-2-macroglobulin